MECPAELVEMTQLKRKDDPSTFQIEEENRPPPYQVGPTSHPWVMFIGVTCHIMAHNEGIILITNPPCPGRKCGRLGTLPLYMWGPGLQVNVVNFSLGMD